MGKAFQVVGEEESQQQSPPQPRAPSPEAIQAAQMLNLAIRTIGQRFVIALSNLFTAIALLSAFLLWRSVLPNPSMNQIIGLSLYAGFILAIELVRRK